MSRATWCGCFECCKKDEFGRNKAQYRRHNCHDCNCGKLKCDCFWLCGGEAAIYVCICILFGCVLMFPVILYAMIAVPFLLIAQYITSRVDSKIEFWKVVIIFVILLIPPFVIWFLLFDDICSGQNSGGGVLCFVWSVVNTIYE